MLIILGVGKTNTNKGIYVPVGTIIGISMVAAGVIFGGGVIWRGVSYPRRQRDLQRGLDD
jgi:hypothetical protein